MTNITHGPAAFAGRTHAKLSLYTLEGELEKLDREAGHDYLPMDVYIDPRTINEHFRESSIRSRLIRSLSGTA